MLEDLEAGAIRFGADKSRGRGKLCLDPEKTRISNLDLAEGILDTLVRGEAKAAKLSEFFSARTGGEEIAAVRPRGRCIGLTLVCQPVAPVMQRHEAEGAAADIMPAIAIEGDKRKPLLSGTGIKGAFRAQSERILRTVLGRDEIESEPLELITALYGAKAEKTKKAAGDGRNDPHHQPGRGAVSFDDHRLDRPVSLEHWHSLLTLAVDEPSKRLAALGKESEGKGEGKGWSNFTPAMLVAIDRWTGGAADKFLYSRLEPDLTKMTLSASIDVDRITPPPSFWSRFDPTHEDRSGNHGEPDRDLDKEGRELDSFRGAALALFLLTLRDFALGRIPLGYGVNRGLGDLHLDSATFTGWPSRSPPADGPDRGPTEPSPAEAASAGGFQCLNDATARDQDYTADIALSKASFGDRESMSRFQLLQEAWRDYLERNTAKDDP